MAAVEWVRKMLEMRGVPYQELHHREAFTAQEVAHLEHVSGHRVAKVVCIMADGQPVELVLPASRRVQLDAVRTLLGVQEVRLASEQELERYFPDCEVGAMPALRHWRGVEVIMDGHLCCGGDVVLPAGTHRDAVRMKFDDWFALVQPRVELLSEAA